MRGRADALAPDAVPPATRRDGTRETRAAVVTRERAGQRPLPSNSEDRYKARAATGMNRA